MWVIGAGKIGSLTSLLLTNIGYYQAHVIDQDPKAIKRLSKAAHLHAHTLDVSNEQALRKFCETPHVMTLVNCLPSSALGSGCGIADINIGTSGTEIGGAFGGEKDTGVREERWIRTLVKRICAGKLPRSTGVRIYPWRKVYILTLISPCPWDYNQDVV